MPPVARTLAAVVLAIAAIASVQAGRPRMAVLPGTATVVEGAAVPAGAKLRVELHDMSPGIAKDATVAKDTFEIAAKPPIRFELSYVEDEIDPSRLYGIAAMITDSRGEKLWETRVPIRVLTLGNQKSVQLVLRPVERKAPPEPTSLSVECEGLRFHVDLSPTSATVVVQDSKVVLPRTEAPAGKRYSDGTTTLALSGSAAYFQWSAHAYRDCKVSAEPASGPKP